MCFTALFCFLRDRRRAKRAAQNSLVLDTNANTKTSQKANAPQEKLEKEIQSYQTAAIPPMPTLQDSSGVYIREKPWKCEGDMVIKGATIGERARTDPALRDLYEDFLHGGGEGEDYVKNFLYGREKGGEKGVVEDDRSVGSSIELPILTRQAV